MGILDTAKDVVSIVQKIDNIELYKQILSLQSEILKLVDENTNLRQEVSSLKEELKIKGLLRYDASQDAYYCDTGTPELEGPFCQVCWDVDKKLVRMAKGGYEGIFCRYCSNVRQKA